MNPGIDLSPDVQILATRTWGRKDDEKTPGEVNLCLENPFSLVWVNLTPDQADALAAQLIEQAALTRKHNSECSKN